MQVADTVSEREHDCVPPYGMMPKKKPVYEAVKRLADIVLSALALLVLSPVFLAVAIAIKAEDGGNVFYRSIRLTKNGREFTMYKFRSMEPDAESKLDSLMDRNEIKGPAFKISNDPRVTRVGAILRKTSVDELPQLLNIIRGEMSIIGPRPPLPKEVLQYNAYQMHRLDVKTGLACYHECMGRSNQKDFDEWVALDLKYIAERSIRTDLRIIFMTIRAVLTGNGAA